MINQFSIDAFYGFGQLVFSSFSEFGMNFKKSIFSIQKGAADGLSVSLINTDFRTDINLLLAWYFQRMVDDVSYFINVKILGKPREDYLTELMKMQTPGTWFGTGADVSCGSALMDYQNRQRQAGPTAYASKLQAHEDRLQRQKEKEDERKARAAEAARKAQEAREARAQDAEADNSDD